jgi:PKHD-type hydroxylase
MKGEWCYFKSYFSKEFCESVIEEASKLPLKSAGLGEDGLTENNQYRKSDVAWLYPEKFDNLYEEIWKLERIANKEWFGFHIDNLEYIQFAKYDSKVLGEYKKHQDIFWVGNNPRHRKLSAVIQLSDPSTYSGGNLELLECNEYPNSDDIRQQGSIIFFPSFVYHKANPVTSGIRYSLAVWFEGPYWR